MFLNKPFKLLELFYYSMNKRVGKKPSFFAMLLCVDVYNFNLQLACSKTALKISGKSWKQVITGSTVL